MLKSVFNCSKYSLRLTKIAGIVMLFSLYLYICVNIFDKHAIYYYKYEMGGYLPFSNSTRVILSTLWFTLLLGIFATPYLYQKKYFERQTFYLVYRKFWYVGGSIFSLLLLMLTGLTPPNIGNPYFNLREAIFYFFPPFFLIYFIVWRLTVYPANMQYESQETGT